MNVMTTWIIVGECPECGAPIWADKECINEPAAPDVAFSCTCRIKPVQSTITVPSYPQPWINPRIATTIGTTNAPYTISTTGSNSATTNSSASTINITIDPTTGQTVVGECPEGGP